MELCAAKVTSTAPTWCSARVICGNTLHFLALLYAFPPSFEWLQMKISFGSPVLVSLYSCPKASGNCALWRGTEGFFHENIYVDAVPEPTTPWSSLKCKVNLRHSLWSPYCLCRHLKTLWMGNQGCPHHQQVPVRAPPPSLAPALL